VETDEPTPDPGLIAASLVQARADAAVVRKKRAKARIYRRGGYLMLGLLAITALLCLVFVVVN
jgi:hypothetical protein